MWKFLNVIGYKYTINVLSLIYSTKVLFHERYEILEIFKKTEKPNNELTKTFVNLIAKSGPMFKFKGTSLF